MNTKIAMVSSKKCKCCKRKRVKEKKFMLVDLVKVKEWLELWGCMRSVKGFKGVC